MAGTKVALWGEGTSGRVFSLAAVCRGICDELLVTGCDLRQAEKRVWELRRASEVAEGRVAISVSDDASIADAELVMLTSGSFERDSGLHGTELRRFVRELEGTVDRICQSGFDGIFLVATPRAELVTELVRRRSGFDASAVLGLGTVTETIRMRRALAERFVLSPKEIQAYVIGDREGEAFVPWSQVYAAGKSVAAVCKGDAALCGGMRQLEDSVVGTALAEGMSQSAADGISLFKTVKAILRDEKRVLTVAACPEGEYGESGVCLSLPCVVGKKGVEKVMTLDLSGRELDRLSSVCDRLRSLRREIT